MKRENVIGKGGGERTTAKNKRLKYVQNTNTCTLCSTLYYSNVL